MKTIFLLIVLTQNGAGDINASFVNTETLDQCEQKALMLQDVFKSSNIPVIESRCVKSDLRFSEFGHAASSSMIRNFYLVKFDDAVVKINKIPDWEMCVTQAKQATGKTYCSSSVQSLKK